MEGRVAVKYRQRQVQVAEDVLLDVPGDAAALVADADAHVVDVGRSEVGVRRIRDGKEGSGGRVEETHDATCVALNEEIIA